LKYYDLLKNWRKVKPHLGDPELNDVLVREFNKYTTGMFGKEFTRGRYAREFDRFDWRLEQRGRPPRYWDYVCTEACHWLVNFTLRLAVLVEPNRPWRIITSQKHSTVWDGEETLFDFNFQALGIPPLRCFKLSREEELLPGQSLETGDTCDSSRIRGARRAA